MAISFKLRRKKEGPDQPKEKKSFISKYNTFCFRLLGKRIEARGGEGQEKLANKLRQANQSFTPGMYLARIYVTSLLVATISVVTYTLIFGLILSLSIWPLYVLILTGVCTGASYLVFPFIVSNTITNRAFRIDQELPFTLSELSILASTGLSPVEIIRKIAKRQESETISGEFKKTVYKMDIEGKDLITAISDTARETPSQSLRETLWDLANMIHQGGDLDTYLRSKADDVMKTKRATQKEFVDKLATFSDIYITVVLIGVLFIGIGAFLIDAMGSSAMGFSADTLLFLLTFVMLPMAIFFIGLMVSMAYSKVE